MTDTKVTNQFSSLYNEIKKQQKTRLNARKIETEIKEMGGDLSYTAVAPWVSHAEGYGDAPKRYTPNTIVWLSNWASKRLNRPVVVVEITNI